MLVEHESLPWRNNVLSVRPYRPYQGGRPVAIFGAHTRSAKAALEIATPNRQIQACA